MNILVTGGAGYIGSHTCKALALEGMRPIAYDNLIYGHRDSVRWGPLVEGDLADSEKLAAVIREFRPSAVLHFAAYAYVGESVLEPAKYYQNNVGGTLSLLEAMRAEGVRHIVFSSTCATYGHPLSTPIAEDHPQVPINPYGAGKLMVERILRDYGDAYGFRSIALRYFNAAGADPQADIGERHDPETHLIPLVLGAAAGKRPPLTIFGDDYETPDGTCVRDYIHVSDLADAHVLALRALQAGVVTNAYNLGNGRGFSVREIVAEAQRVTGLEVPFTVGARREGDPAHLVGDARSAKAALGWRPRLDSLTDILGSAWQWELKETARSKG
jgi:UDP-arabinose 4-epimerase